MIAVSHVVFGWGAYDSSTVTWLYGVWPVLFGLSAIACLAAADRFEPVPVALAGALTVVSYTSRAGILLVGTASGRIDLDWARVIFGGAVWLMLAFYAAVLWLRAFGPLAQLWHRRDQ